MKYFDLHADTPHRLRHGGASLHIPPEEVEGFTEYRQIFACVADEALSDDEAFHDILQMHTRFRGERVYRPHTAAYAVEDLRILGGRLSRIPILLRRGFRVFTPLWGGTTCIGGAWDTDSSLTPFGQAAVRSLAASGALLDISHASDAAAYEIARVCSGYALPILATHSAARAVHPHRRNLSDELARLVIRSGGLVGLPLVSYFLSDSPAVYPTALLAHISHFLSLGARDALCLGCDLDGTTSLPIGINSIKDIYSLADIISAHFSPELAAAVCYQNAQRFFARYTRLTR